MQRKRTVCLITGLICIGGAILFSLLMSFTPVKQKFYEPLLFSSMEELGYRVVLVQEQGNAKVLNLEVLKGEFPDEKRFQELLAEAQKLAAAKYGRIVRGWTIVSLILGLLLLAISIVLDVFAEFRAVRTRPKGKVVHKNTSNTSILTPVVKPPPTVNNIPMISRVSPSWEEMVSKIQKQLDGVEDLSVREQLQAQFHALCNENGRRRRVSKLEYFSWHDVAEAIEQQGVTVLRDP